MEGRVLELIKRVEVLAKCTVEEFSLDKDEDIRGMDKKEKKSAKRTDWGMMVRLERRTSSSMEEVRIPS